MFTEGYVLVVFVERCSYVTEAYLSQPVEEVPQLTEACTPFGVHNVKVEMWTFNQASSI